MHVSHLSYFIESKSYNNCYSYFFYSSYVSIFISVLLPSVVVQFLNE